MLENPGCQLPLQMFTEQPERHIIHVLHLVTFICPDCKGSDTQPQLEA